MLQSTGLEAEYSRRTYSRTFHLSGCVDSLSASIPVTGSLRVSGRVVSLPGMILRPTRPFHTWTCRNVLIYLGSTIQDRILQSLHYGLKPGGALVLGSAEMIGDRSDLFAIADQQRKIFLKKQVLSRLGIEYVPADGMSPDMPDLGVPIPFPRAAALDLEGRAARILRDLYAPAGVIVNDDMPVLHLHGQTTFYLEPAQGEASLNLMRLARPSLIYSLRTAMDRVRETKHPATEAGVRAQYDGVTREITLRVIPLGDGARSYLVLFEEPGKTGLEAQGPAAPATSPDQEGGSAGLQLVHAQRENTQMREYLRKVTEQYEAATEELRAANEEARSSNEELQSTNEELRTAKEELQSSNEELTTVNDELKNRNKELRLANNDLTNVLGAATIPILMVDMDLRLRRFTPAAERLLRLASADIGQPNADVQHGFQMLDVNEKLRHAINHLEIHHWPAHHATQRSPYCQPQPRARSPAGCN
jgi:two-component system CheB/CheR fusion protein